MTHKQKQWQLFLLGYLPDQSEIDGMIGPVTKAATEQFQANAGIRADGDFGPSTEAKSMAVVEDIQEVLRATIDNTLKVDGLAGPKTMAALVWYQKARGLTPNGIADEETLAQIRKDEPDPEETGEETFWEDIQYFTREELRCKCGGRYCNGFPAEPKELLVRLAERARKHFGAPAHNISCLRCRQHNANEGGVANSQHMYGEAMDIRIDGVTGDQLLAFFQKQPEVRYTYKINSTNVHFDIPKGKR